MRVRRFRSVVFNGKMSARAVVERDRTNIFDEMVDCARETTNAGLGYISHPKRLRYRWRLNGTCSRNFTRLSGHE